MSVGTDLICVESGRFKRLRGEAQRSETHHVSDFEREQWEEIRYVHTSRRLHSHVQTGRRVEHVSLHFTDLLAGSLEFHIPALSSCLMFV